jgi:hypothetical protein
MSAGFTSKLIKSALGVGRLWKRNGLGISFAKLASSSSNMLTVYLATNAVLYIVFAAWCTLAPKQTSEFLGLTPANPAGESEYLAVYGGLQAGLAVFFTIATFAPDHRRAALLLALALYGGLVAMRTFSGLRLGFAEIGNARFAYGLEIALFLIALVLVLRGARSESA